MLEDGTPQQYQIKVMSELLVQAHIASVDIDDFVGFFGSQIQAMFASPPNFNMWGKKEKVWIMRGFYPGTHIFFKLILMPRNSESDDTGGYFAKASPMRVVRRFKKGYTGGDDFVYLGGDQLNEDITDRMENSLFGANHELKPIISKKMKMPRCMSPKGIKVFNYKKLKKARKITRGH